MKKRRIFVGLLVCLLLLPHGALGAVVMDGAERPETPLGEATPACAPDVAAPETKDLPAVLADGGHTAVDHAAWTGLAAAGELSAGSYYLTGDVTGALAIPAGATVDLCLNGHTLDANAAGSAITVGAGATLNLHDCVGGGKVTGGNASMGGGLNVSGTAAARSAVHMYGGSIEGNTAGNGGGARVANGSFAMHGGSISNNTTPGRGGGVIVTNGAFSMEGDASVSGNRAQTGGGLYAASNSALEISGGEIEGNIASASGGVEVYGLSTLTMSAGTIANNQGGDQGGGVRASAGSFALSGGTITGNTANNGGGVFVASSGLLSLSGDPAVSGNRDADGAADSICLLEGGRIAVDGEIASGATFGISMVTPGIFSDAGCGGYRDCFFSDDPDFSVGADAQGRLFLGGALTYHVPQGATGTVPLPTVYPLDEKVTLEDTFPLRADGYQQIAWTGARDTIAALKAVTVKKNTTVYPVFAREFQATTKGDAISLVYKQPMAEVDLNDYVQLVDSQSGADRRFGFAPAKDQSLPAGLKLDVKTGKITGTPTVDCGSYEMTFTVRDLNGIVTLFGLEPSPAVNTAELTITFVITPATPTAGDFTFVPPANLSYDGKRKMAAVTPKDGVSGMGAVTVKYAPATPIEKGTYTVSIDVAQGKNYQSATGLADSAWSFTITDAPARGVTLGAPQWSGGRTTISLTATPANLLAGAGTKVIAARYDQSGAMTDLAWGALSGNTVTFSGKRVSAGDGWKLFFLSAGSAPLCPAAPV